MSILPVPDSLFLLSIISSLEKRRLISSRKRGEPFQIGRFSPIEPANIGPLRLVFDVLKVFGWIKQLNDNEYAFKGPTAAVYRIPVEADALFTWLAPERERLATDQSSLSRWSEWAALNWNLDCPALVCGFNTLFAQVLLRWLSQAGAIEIETGTVDLQCIDKRHTHSAWGRRLTDFLIDQRWLRENGTLFMLPSTRREQLSAWLNAPGPHPHARLPALLDGLLFGQGAQWAASSQWLKDEGLMTLAHVGLFPEPGLLHTLARDEEPCGYQARAYRVRYATMDDLPALLALEAACWPEGGRVDAAILRRRLSQWSAGQLVLTLAGDVIGVIYSQRISHINDLCGVNFAQVDQLYHPDGPIVHIQSLNILPAHQYSGYGDQLLEFMLQYCTLLNGIDTVVGVTRCKDYPKHPHTPLKDYIHCRNSAGILLDPILRFHELHGARIERLVAGYRPADHDNAGNGVLVHYDLARRQRQALPLPTRPTILSDKAIETMVRQEINRCLGQPEDHPLSPQRSLIELGLDSADLLTLGEQLGLAIGQGLEPSFFFRYNRLDKIIAALIARLKEHPNAQPVEVSQPSHAGVAHDEFAVVGISGCFPAGELEAFWQAVQRGDCQLRDMPAERCQPASWGGYLDEIDCFDHAFWGLSASEAALMDPQQRLLLQYAWRAFEDAGILPAQWADSPTGVFVTAAPSQYHEMVETPTESPFLLTSSSPCMYANRISFLLDLSGPSEYCHTACSSALVALHRAMQAMRAGECQQALVGAVNLLLSPSETAAYRRMGFLSSQRQPRSFQTQADGYVRSEGVGVVLLKPFAAALRDRDRIYLKIKGSAVHHGGQGASLVAPNQDSMQAAMVAAYRSAGIDPDSVDYIEAHGTASPLGDAIEIAAMEAARTALSREDYRGEPWQISTLKPVIGHCELASGMAALFKVIDAIAQQRLPGIPGYAQCHSVIPSNTQAVCLETNSRAWPARRDTDGVALPRRASINSYGFGGVNAHLVVEEYIAPLRVDLEEETRPQLILLSARDAAALQQQAARLSRYLHQHPHLSIADIAYTLQQGRTAFACRWTCVVDNITSLQQQLDALAASPAEAFIVLDEHVMALDPACADSTFPQALADHDLPVLAALWRQGLKLDWRQLPRVGAPRRITLPGYAFAKTRHWLPAKKTASVLEKTVLEEEGKPSFRQILAQLLGVEPAAFAGCESRSLASLGLSSLAAIELKTHLAQRLQLSVPLTQLNPYLCLEEVETHLAKSAHQANPLAIPPWQAVPEDWAKPFVLNDIQQSFLSGRLLLPEVERVGCHIYLEFDWPDLDIDKLNQAWNRLIGYHAMLRARILDEGRQQISDAVPYGFQIQDLRQTDPYHREQHLIAIRQAMSHQVYLPGHHWLFDIRVSMLAAPYCRVHLSIDELIVDATSLDLLLQQWLMLYRDPAAELPDHGLSFRDYQCAIEAFKSSTRYQHDLQYWVDKLTRMPPGLSLPKSATPASRWRRRLVGCLAPERWQRLKARGDALGVSGTALLLALFGLILKQTNAGQPFSLIATFYNRLPLHLVVNELVGPLISTYFYAFEDTEGDTLAEWLQRVQRQQLEDMDHLSVSGVAVLRECRRRYGKSWRFSQGEVVFTSMLNNPVIGRADSFGDVQHDSVSQTPQINLDHQLREREGALHFSWDVAIDCYPEGMIDTLFTDYRHLLERLADSDVEWQTMQAHAAMMLAPNTPPMTPFALTDQQQAYAFSRSLHPTLGSAHLYLSMSIDNLDMPRLAWAWQQLVAHHPMLRTKILANGTQQLMDVTPPQSVEWHREGGASLTEQMLSQPAALGSWPYAQLWASPLEGKPSLVHLAVDLLIADLPSRDLLVRQLLELYQGNSLAPLSIHFAGFVEAQKQRSALPAAQRDLDYWQEKFRLLPQGPRMREAHAHDCYASYEHRLACWPILRHRAERAGISCDALLMSAYAWSMAKHHSKRPFTLVAPGWQRPAMPAQMNALVGDFTMLSWVDFNDAPMTFLERAKRCDQIFTQDQRHSAISGLQALRKVATDKQQPRKLNFPAVFTRLNPYGPLDLPAGVTLVHIASRTQGIALDHLSTEWRDILLIHWDVATQRLSQAQAAAMFADYCRLLEALATDDWLWNEQENRLDAVLAAGEPIWK